ncbi:hypothetical protein J6590_057270 [Homalodisca vitripennis]|nr:hypothetical protein J6590_057270 [Homalodisca vitripennis]
MSKYLGSLAWARRWGLARLHLTPSPPLTNPLPSETRPELETFNLQENDCFPFSRSRLNYCPPVSRVNYNRQQILIFLYFSGPPSSGLLRDFSSGVLGVHMERERDIQCSLDEHCVLNVLLDAQLTEDEKELKTTFKFNINDDNEFVLHYRTADMMTSPDLAAEVKYIMDINTLSDVALWLQKYHDKDAEVARKDGLLLIRELSAEKYHDKDAEVARKDGLLLIRELAAEVKNMMDIKMNAVMKITLVRSVAARGGTIGAILMSERFSGQWLSRRASEKLLSLLVQCDIPSLNKHITSPSLRLNPLPRTSWLMTQNEEIARMMKRQARAEVNPIMCNGIGYTDHVMASVIKSALRNPPPTPHLTSLSRLLPPLVQTNNTRLTLSLHMLLSTAFRGGS